MRYSEEQITYHYTRDRTVLTKALLRRGFSPRSAVPLPASGLLDPAYASFHAATMEAQKALERGAARYVAEAEAAAITAP